jgi:TrmH family RNA methyltransferase
MPTITSRQNAIVSRYRATARGESRHLLMDGPHLVRDALDAGTVLVEAAVRADASDDREIELLVDTLERARVEVYTVSSPVMNALSPVQSSAGIVALARRPEHSETVLYVGSMPFVLIAADVQDPGNVGAIVRVAEAAGASGLIAAGACADPYGWKALRGSMGSALRLPIVTAPSSAAAVATARSRGCRIVATAPRGGQPLFGAALDGPVAILIGSEGVGVAEPLMNEADELVTIPMAPGVESLNTAVAAALMMYEVRRRRNGFVSDGLVVRRR